MLARVCLVLALLVSARAWPQSSDEMTVSPVVSGIAYPGEVGSETRSNYLSGGVGFSGGYIHNVYAGSGSSLVNDTTFIVAPSISYDQTTTRFHEAVSYSPSFTFYQPTGSLNSSNQSAALDFQYRLSPHVSFRAADSLTRASNAFAQTSATAVSGTTQTITPGIVAPYLEQLTNTSSGEASWQFSRGGMIGATGNATELHFPRLAAGSGLSDASTEGGGAFYNHRLDGGKYLGANYEYSRTTETQLGIPAVVQTDYIMPFLTVYLTPTFTFSISGGSQYYSISSFGTSLMHAWQPAGNGSVAWQGLHTSFAASYNRTITAGAGLAGAFQSSSANADFRWQMARTWTGGASGNYGMNKNADTLPGTAAGGHTIRGTASLEHSLNNQAGLSFLYSRIHQSYPGVTAISADPDTDQILISLSYRFSRPVGQ
ncbi:MAG TPA: hypothetical protein VIY53_10750 [Acidobacteriaceae bacterium]